jgi:hypothetical protein
MKVGQPIILSYTPEEKEDQTKTNNRIAEVVNENIDKVFRAFRGNVSFEENIEGTYYQNYEAEHNTSQRVAHKLGRSAFNAMAIGGTHSAKVLITETNTRLATIRVELPRSFFTAAVAGATTGFVADPYEFKVNDKVVVASDPDTEVVVSAIDYPNRELTFSSAITAAQYENVYVRYATLNVFIF